MLGQLELATAEEEDDEFFQAATPAQDTVRATIDEEEDLLQGAPVRGYFVDESSSLDFVQIRETGGEDGNTTFEMYEACSQDIAIATGHVTSDGEIFVDSVEPGADPVQLAQFTDKHEFQNLDHQYDDRLIGQRVEGVDCSTLHEYHESGLSEHSLAFHPEEEELLQASAPANDGGPNGLSHLTQAIGEALPLGPEKNEPTHSDVPSVMKCQSPDGRSVDCPETPDQGHEGLVECSVQNWSESRQASTKDIVALLDIDEVYPGALVQGGEFAAGGFTPITIPRTGTTLSLYGLALAGTHKIPIDTVTRGNVVDAIGQFLVGSDVLGTAADASFSTEQVYSAEQFAMSLGISAGIQSLPAKIKGKIEASNDSVENTIVSQFTQVYYTVSFDTPERSFSVFRDAEDFDDPDDQIGEGNPPLYVSSVKYGRQVFFFLRSTYGAKLLKATLESAANLEAADVEVSAGLTYKDIMDKTSVSYVVRGGAAGESLTAIDSATPAEMFSAIKSVLANPKVADFSASSPGVPVAYTLKYLTNNHTAMTSYATTYDRRDCRVYPAHDYQYSLEIKHSDWHGWVNLDILQDFGHSGVIAGPYTESVTTTLELNDFLSDKEDHSLILSTYSSCSLLSSWTAGGNWTLYVDGAKRWHDSFHKNYLQCLATRPFGINGLKYKAEIQINRATGKVNVLSID